MKHLSILFYFLFFTTVIISQNKQLQSGPMVGYSDYREALIWVQTTQAAKVKIGYWDSSNIKKFTSAVTTDACNDFIAKLYPIEVAYGTSYDYEVYIDGKRLKFDYPLQFQTQTLWKYRTDPPEINFAIGSCVYVNDVKDDRPGRPYGSGYEAFDNILQQNPDFMVWLGDNVYLREPDFGTATGIKYRYKHSRSLPEMQALLGSVHHYAIWDDHDYGPNDSDKSYALKKVSEATFNNYWGNPTTNVVGNGGVTSTFQWGDIEFFLMDNRYHRDSNRQLSPNKAYLGEAQLEWLITALTSSRAPFKFVCIGGQVINSAGKYENYATYPEERAELFRRIAAERIEGVIFFSGDRHHTEISKMEREGAYPLFDITCSSITSGSHKPSNENNVHLVPNTSFFKQNFGMIKVSGKRTDRVMTLDIIDTKGNKIYDYTINAKDLKYSSKGK